jgi:hypothetical protein
MPLSAAELEQLYDRIAAQDLTLADATAGYELDDITVMIVDTRGALRDGLLALPDSAFEPQPPDAAGNPVWSAGEVITHCNMAVLALGGRAFSIFDVTFEDPTGVLAEYTELRPLSREEALVAVDALDLDAFIATIPDDADPLAVNTEPHRVHGQVSAQGWLMYVAIHEADHVGQFGELAGDG